MADPFAPVRAFERALCEYTGAPYAVAVNSCSMALVLALAYMRPRTEITHVTIPRRTYVSVPMAAMHARFGVRFRDEDWCGVYEIEPVRVYDSARWFTSQMFNATPVLYGRMDEERVKRPRYVCVSFHHSKTLGDTQGGAILHNSADADAWLRRARFDGRTEGVQPSADTFDVLGYHCYMSPDVAARLTWRLSKLPAHNDPLPNDDYPDLSKAPLFR